MKVEKFLNIKAIFLLVVGLHFMLIFAWLHFAEYTIHKNFFDSVVVNSYAQVNNNIQQNKLITINEDLSQGLRGIDVNANGIRDDIDQLIARDFSQTPFLKKAAEQKALALQSMLEAKNKTDVFVAVGKLSRAGACVYKILPERTREHQKLRRAISREIESLTANTRERLDKYLLSNKLAGGGYFSDPPEPVCD